ncbi:hypothetical protein ACR79T_10215 [Sphingobacterium spiritivorum]|uniref:hypothetical protein n=1 Tax=Sphingobacterium spiritivorum TaxID=258 RepID=UPI003DA6653D
MGILKKIKKTKPLKIGHVTSLILNINKLKENKLLQTTDTGIFYTYPEVINNGKNPAAFSKNLYIYARSTNLLKIGEVLQIRDIENGKLLVSVLADKVTFVEW